MKTGASPSLHRLTLAATGALGLLLSLPAPASAQTVYVTNFESRTVMKFTPAGKATKFADVGPGQPSGLATDGRGNLYVGVNDGLKGKILRYAATGASTVFASGLGQVQDLAFHCDTLYAAIYA